MGCGASKTSDADPLSPSGARNKSSSVVSVKGASPAQPAPTHAREESNPFLDKQPGIDDHKQQQQPGSARKKVERSEEKEEVDDMEELATPKGQGDSKKAAEEQKEKDSDDDEADDKDKEAAAEGKDSHRDKTSGRQLLPASTPVTPAASSTRPAIMNATLTPARKDGTALVRSNTFTDVVLQQPPSYNLTDPLTLTSGMSKCFLHYAHKKFDASHSQAASESSSHGGGDDDDEDKLDKKAVAQLAYDCVVTFMLALKKEMAKVKEINRKKEEDYQRRRNLPGETVDEVLDTCKEYLKSELVWKNGGITKTCFFFHFPRAFRALFVYEKMTLEREQLVVKWNKVCADNRAKAEKDKEKERKKDEAQMAGAEPTADGAADKEKGEKDKDKKHKKKKDKDGRKTNRKARQTAPANSDLFANMANHGSKPPQLAQAEAKLKSAQHANGKGSSRNLLKGVEKDDED